MPHWTDSISFYEQAGFGVAGLFPVTLNACRVIECDCLMVRIWPLRANAARLSDNPLRCYSTCSQAW
jgi:hypothetical protein